MPNFVAAIGQNVAKIWQFFYFFNTAVAAILDFYFFLILTLGHVKRVEMRQCAKFRGNRSIRFLDMWIFLFFKTAAAAILDF